MKLYTKRKKAYVFDLDDVLISTDAKIYVFNDNKLVTKLSSKEYADHKLKENEYYDFSEFKDPSFIKNGTEASMFPALINIDKAVKEGRSNSIVYILTARESDLIPSIYYFFKDRKIDAIPRDNIYTVGDIKTISGAESKKMMIESMLNEGTDIIFFDDDSRNIDIANTIPGVQTRFIKGDDI